MKSVMLREFILFQEGRLEALHLSFPNSSSCARSFSLRYATRSSLRRSSSSLHQSSPAPHESSIVRVTPCLFVTCAKISQFENPKFRFKCRWRAAGGVSLWHVRKLMKSVMLREFILFQEGRLAARHLSFPNSSCSTSFV